MTTGPVSRIPSDETPPLGAAAASGESELSMLPHLRKGKELAVVSQSDLLIPAEIEIPINYPRNEENMRAGDNMCSSFGRLCSFVGNNKMTSAVFALGLIFFLTACTMFYFSASAQNLTIAHHKFPVTIIAGVWFLSWSIGFFMELKRYTQRNFLEERIRNLEHAILRERGRPREALQDVVAARQLFLEMEQPPESIAAEFERLGKENERLRASLDTLQAHREKLRDSVQHADEVEAAGQTVIEGHVLLARSEMRFEQIPEQIRTDILRRRSSVDVHYQKLQKRMDEASTFTLSKLLTISVALIGLSLLALSGYSLYAYLQKAPWLNMFGDLSLPLIGGLFAYGCNFLLTARSSYKLYKVEEESLEATKEWAAQMRERGPPPAFDTAVVAREHFESIQMVKLKRELDDLGKKIRQRATQISTINKRFAEFVEAPFEAARAPTPKSQLGPGPAAPYLEELVARQKNGALKPQQPEKPRELGPGIIEV